MTFRVAEECVQLGLRAGAIVFRSLVIVAASPQLRAEIDREIQAVRDAFPGPAAVRSCPEVAAFQRLHRRAGVNPRKEQSSVERLLLLALKRGELPAINSLVDAYNLISLRTRCSLGAHDLDAIALPVSLRLLTGQESFTPLGESAPSAVAPGEYGYVDAESRLLCRLDVRQADFSKVTERTRNVLLIVESTAEHAPEVLCRAMADVIELATRSCGGTAEVVEA
ncbi:MAG TPA: phenylalanine--tRNA ligase beta subunit-related protein [Gemmataceae bacterium]|nr:phenylalanine--tRNA ligase beta subunit-related protein [Gemmataceae bacterium]